MKYYGDIPADHLELVRELTVLEEWFRDHGTRIPALSSAKGFVSMAHDFYSMYMDEDGERLLKKANELCPGYFSGPIFIHIDEDGDFAHLIGNLLDTPGLDLMVSLGFKDEQV